MSLSEEYIDSIISHVASNIKCIEWKWHVQEFDKMGQNYFGLIMPITITGFSTELSSKTKRANYHIVLKLAPTDERYRVSGAVTVMFRKEIFVYSVLLKKYDEIQQKVAFWPPFEIPAMYFVRDEYCKEVIAMRDMCRDGGFKPYTHTKFLSLDHVIVSLESLARLHALSFILKESDCKLYKEVTQVCSPLTESSNKRFMEIMRDRLTKAIAKFEGTQYVALLENMKLNCGKLFDRSVELAKGTCISHGDVWKENILFKNEEDTKTLTACLIDYQTARVSSPAFDTLYLIISSTDTHLRKDNYYNLLDIYYEAFHVALKSIMLDSKVVYPRESLDHDLKLVAPACFITANTALWLSNGLQEEGHVRSKQVWKTAEEKALAVNNYKSVIQAIVDDLYSYGYFPGDIL